MLEKPKEEGLKTDTEVALFLLHTQVTLVLSIMFGAGVRLANSCLYSMYSCVLLFFVLLGHLLAIFALFFTKISVLLLQ